MTLTDAQRRALHNAAHKGGARVAPPFTQVPRTELPAQTARGLHDQALLVIVESTRVVLTRGERSPARTRVALITKAGRKALDEPVPEVPLFMTEGAPYSTTSLPHRAVRGEPEVIDPATLKAHHVTEAAHRFAQAVDRRQAARDAAGRARRAA